MLSLWYALRMLPALGRWRSSEHLIRPDVSGTLWGVSVVRVRWSRLVEQPSILMVCIRLVLMVLVTRRTSCGTLIWWAGKRRTQRLIRDWFRCVRSLCSVRGRLLVALCSLGGNPAVIMVLALWASLLSWTLDVFLSHTVVALKNLMLLVWVVLKVLCLLLVSLGFLQVSPVGRRCDSFRV